MDPESRGASPNEVLAKDSQFLIHRDGIVRRADAECAQEGLAGIGKFPSVEEILAVARALS